MDNLPPHPARLPKWLDKLLNWLVAPHLREEVLGDLHERYHRRVQRLGVVKARSSYWQEILAYLRPSIIKRKPAQYPSPESLRRTGRTISSFSSDMLRNFIKITWRILVQYKLQSLINILGLAFGMTCFFLIALYLFDELTFDTFHANSDRIYRITEQRTSPDGKQTKVASVAYNIGSGAQNTIPEVQQSTRVSMLGRTNVTNEKTNTTFYKELWLANQGFTTVFSYDFVAGDPKTALQQPFTAVLTRQMAQQLFGVDDAVGRIFRTDAFDTPFRVTGVCENIPKNSSFQFDILFSEVSIDAQPWFNEGVRNDWTSNRFVTFLLLKEGVSAGTVSNKIGSLVRANVKPAQAVGQFTLQPLRDIHFYSADIQNGADHPGDIAYVYVFAVIALFVLLIACINYINLTTARASRRLKEIGIRKVSGAQRTSLAGQFLMESLFVTVLSLLIAILAVTLTLPAFNAFTEKNLTLNLQTDYRIWLGIGLATVLTSLLSGSYPALLLSRFQPSSLIKGVLTVPGRGAAFRQGLVVFQFTVSVVMIVATLVVYQQLRYVRNKDLGFRKDQLIVVDINSGTVRREFQTIRNEYTKLAGVRQVTVSSRVPGEWKAIPQIDVRGPLNRLGDGTKMSFLGVDENFLSAFNIRLMAGRNFRPNALSDSSAILINEAAARALGIKQPLDQIIEIPSVDFNGNPNPLPQAFKARVVGIVRNFHFRSLHETIAPLIIGYRINPIQSIDYFTVQVSGRDFQQTLDQLDGVLQKIDPEHLFEYHFLDQQLELFYREDARRQTIFMLIALATVFIACLGLFGLAAFTAEQRTKEIGVRKVLGASVASLIALLSKDFLKLVLLAILIASPIAWYAMNGWLAGFAYRIAIEWWMFALAGLLAVGIALLTVSFQSVKAALMNPVKSLRSE